MICGFESPADLILISIMAKVYQDTGSLIFCYRLKYTLDFWIESVLAVEMLTGVHFNNCTSFSVLQSFYSYHDETLLYGEHFVFVDIDI